jgi:PIN domain nuclease of toxin-antitoxin system
MLLDTCALLWLAGGDKRLGREAKARIEAEPVVHVSAITGFEIGMKHAGRKLRLPIPPREWLAAVLEYHHVSVVPLDLETCVLATQLPPIHRDLCDRFIVATAKRNGWPVATADPVFRQYNIDVVW